MNKGTAEDSWNGKLREDEGCGPSLLMVLGAQTVAVASAMNDFRLLHVLHQRDSCKLRRHCNRFPFFLYSFWKGSWKAAGFSLPEQLSMPNLAGLTHRAHLNF
jgi:hypothetical protein